MKQPNTLPVISFVSQNDWEVWLEKNYSDQAGIWLKIAKKGGGIQSIDYPEALEVALCYGWIDGQKRSFDDKFWLQKFTPRRSKSMWSKVNCEKVETLIREGKMRSSGLEQVNLAKSDGRWQNAYDSQSTIAIDADFQQELDNNPKAKEFFNALNSANRYAILWRIQMAKKPETRFSRIQKLIDMLAKQQKLHP